MASLGSAQDEGPRRLPEPAAFGAHQLWHLDAGLVGGLHPSTWGFLFGNHPDLLQLLRPWVQRELENIFGEDHPQVLMLEDLVLNVLPVWGLQEERLVQELQFHLQSLTAVFVQSLILFTVEWCGRRARHLLLRRYSDAAGEGKGSPGEVLCSAAHSPAASTSWAASPSPAAAQGGPAPSSSAVTAGVDNRPGTLACALQGGPGCSLSVPSSIPGEQAEEPAEAACPRCLCFQLRQGLLVSRPLAPSEEEGYYLRGLCHIFQEATPPQMLEGGPTAGRSAARPAAVPHANPNRHQ